MRTRTAPVPASICKKRAARDGPLVGPAQRIFTAVQVLAVYTAHRACCTHALDIHLAARDDFLRLYRYLNTLSTAAHPWLTPASGSPRAATPARTGDTFAFVPGILAYLTMYLGAICNGASLLLDCISVAAPRYIPSRHWLQALSRKTAQAPSQLVGSAPHCFTSRRPFVSQLFPSSVGALRMAGRGRSSLPVHLTTAPAHRYCLQRGYAPLRMRSRFPLPQAPQLTPHHQAFGHTWTITDTSL